MPRQLRPPAPIFLLFFPSFDDPHPAANLTLDGPDPTALLLALNIRRDNERRPLHPPLHPLFLDPIHRLARSSPSAPLHLLVPTRVARTTPEQLAHLLHPHIGREGREIAIVDARVLGRIVVLVFGQLGPHAAVDTEPEAGHVRGGRLGVGGGVQGCEHEFRGGHLGHVGFEGGAPWGGGRGTGVGCRGHGAEEGGETVGWFGSNLVFFHLIVGGRLVRESVDSRENKILVLL